MKNILIRWVILTIAIILAAKFTELLGLGFKVDVSNVSSFLMLMIGAAVLALLNSTLGVLLKVVTLPLSCLTLGLFSIVVNAAVLMIAGKFNLGFSVSNFWAALVGSVMISAVNAGLSMFLPDASDKR